MSPDLQNPLSDETDLPTHTDQKQNLKIAPPRNGKIAKLPQELRNLVNLMLADNATGSAIIAALAEHGISLNHENISNWKHGGFQDWLLEQEWQAEVTVQREYASEMLDTGDPGKFQQAVIQLALTQIFQALKRGSFDGDGSNYTRLLNALSRLAREAFIMKKYADVCARQKFEELDPHRQLTDKDRQIWYSKVEEMFRLKPGELVSGAQSQPRGTNGSEPIPQDKPELQVLKK